MEGFFLNTIENILNAYNECLNNKVSSNKLKAYQKELIWFRNLLYQYYKHEEITEEFYKEQSLKLVSVDFDAIKDYKNRVK
jgi:hypothetical protein